MSSHDVLRFISTKVFVESSEHLYKSLLQRLKRDPLANYHSVPHKVAARARLKVTMSDQHFSAHSHGQASAHSGAMWCQVAPASSFFSFSHITFIESTVKTQLFSPTVSSCFLSALPPHPSTVCKLGQMAAWGPCVHACECMFMHVSVSAAVSHCVMYDKPL